MASTNERYSQTLIDAATKAFSSKFDAWLKLCPRDADPIWINGQVQPPAIETTPANGVTADCEWRASQETMLRVLEGERAFQSAFLSGRLKIAGDMSVMIRLTLSERR
ncbi:MAG: SCP2 sterol-binding domain-containing protein [Pseudomonadota bacterium]